MRSFSYNKDIEQNIGELVLDALLSSNIDSITDLDFKNNNSWFTHPETEAQIRGNADLLAELIFKQPGLKQLDLSNNYFSYYATKAVLTRIANIGSNSLLETLDLGYSANFKA